MQAQPQSERPGFTLIELLVVIAVIMILAGLMFPALNRVRETGNSTRCKSNLRQLQIAVVQYAVNNGGGLPSATSFNWQNDDGTYWHQQGWLEWYDYTPLPKPIPSTPGNYDWRGARGMSCVTNGSLFAYTHSAGIYACPSACLKLTPPDGVWTYSMNSKMQGGLINNDSPANTLLFGDSSVAMNKDQPYTAQFDPINTNSGLNRVKQNPDQLWSGHRGGKANAVFLDGHVESF